MKKVEKRESIFFCNLFNDKQHYRSQAKSLSGGLMIFKNSVESNNSTSKEYKM